MKLEGLTAVVTGASAGIGREIAYLYAKEGATVYAVARRKERLEELTKRAEGLPGKIIAYAADVGNKDEAQAMIAFAYEDSGRLDILVNNAGIMDDFSPVGDVSDDMWDKVLAVNTSSVFYSCRKAVEFFLKQGSGNIINVASIGGLYGSRAGAAYTASKHAVIGLTKNTGYLYANKNIRCNAICPGGVDTEIGTGDYMKEINPIGMENILAHTGNNPRSGTSEEIATIALFLASSDSSFVNGHCIVADSGWTAF